ncbi:alpha-ketoacid dehydrogenase subunit beta [Spongiactinospora sp. 9N601]|uniref:alpha-ketoacid dehydrogenase subunit beta n=1 Tax=Spongiactinospora sp. 9N601 TaxID=3375149 RepID=UPI0037AA8D33
MRVADNLNAALHDLLDRDPRAYLLGEDITDPYGGAFKISRGLSERFPGRVLSTPISEGALTGMAAGLALAGDTAIAEIMFGDFVTLAFDQLVNFAAKSVTMYGKRLPLRMVVRCPSGGGRGYGPTHSQSPQKHLLGVPGLAIYEVSPFHDNHAVFAAMLDRGEPCVLFEDKVLYTRPMYPAAEPFRLTPPETPDGFARVALPGGDPDCVIIATGGTAHKALAAMRALLLEDEITAALLIPSRLYPFDFPAAIGAANSVFVVEESTAGGTWGAEVAHVLHGRMWDRLARPVQLVHSADSIIPTAAHLEERVLVSESSIHRAIRRALRG